MAVSMRNDKGFSLVELMVVVAIIGILAAIAVPNFQRFSAKAKQSEAKSNLAAIYSAENAFSAEWSSYTADFNMIGFKPTGFLKYRLVNAAFDGTPASGYAGPVYAAANDTTATFCGANVIGGGSGTCGETITAGVGCAAPAGSAMTANTFTAAAGSVLYSGGATDTWTITNANVVANPTNGLP